MYSGNFEKYKDDLIRLATEKKSGKEISKILKISYTTVHRYLRKLSINLRNYHNELKFDNTVFDCIDTEEKAYWLGFLYADGNVSEVNNSVEISLKGSDIKHLEKYKTFLKLDRKIKVSKSKCGDKYFERCRCIVTDKHFKDKLIELGCTPKKSLSLKFPDKNIFKNQSLVHDFIRGYVDGDGCITYTSTGRLVLEIIGTKEFLSGILLIFPEIFTEKYYKDKRHTDSNTYSISCSANKADYILEILYRNTKTYLDRKYNRLAVLSSNW